jgi:hypothetical protein
MLVGGNPIAVNKYRVVSYRTYFLICMNEQEREIL